LLFFVFSFLFKSDSSFNQDLGRHLKLGEMIVKTHQIPKTNLFSYTNPGFPFINTHWLFEVWAYFGKGAFGIEGLLFRKLIIVLLAVFIILKIIPKEKSSLLLPIGFIFLHVLRERVELRPEIFSFLFTALSLFILNKFCQMSHDRGTNDKSAWWLFLLPLIQLIWVNTHIYFFVGLILQAIYLIHLSYQQLRSHISSGKLKLLVLVFGLSVITSLVNPNGLTGVLYPLSVSKNYGYTIVENQTMFFLENIKFSDPSFLFVKLSVSIVVLSLVVMAIKRQFEIKNILLSLTGVALALLNVRSFPYLIFLSLPATLQNFPQIKKNQFLTFLSTIFAILLILESYFYLNGDYYRYRDEDKKPGLQSVENGKKALDFVLSNDLPRPIYNNFDIGSYIIYRGYPKYQVFVDGRPEAYPKDFFQQTYIPAQSDFGKFKDLESKYQFKTIIFSHTDQTPWAKQFLQSLFKDQSWKLVYIDNLMIVLVKEEVIKDKNLAIVDLSKLSPNQYNFSSHRDYLQLGLFLFSQNMATGKLFIEKALQLFPNSPAANTIMAQFTADPTYASKSRNIFFW